jgi:hypothetical protein
MEFVDDVPRGATQEDPEITVLSPDEDPGLEVLSSPWADYAAFLPALATIRPQYFWGLADRIWEGGPNRVGLR